jgi:hypothetical protein
MTPAIVTDPELVRSPGHSRTGIAHFHRGAAALTTDVKLGVAHGRDFITWRS